MSETKTLTPISPYALAQAAKALKPPALITLSGSPSQNAWHDFFETIQNQHTRAAYEHAVRKFLDWLGTEIPLHEIRPAHVGRYIAGYPGGIPTRKLHLAALRSFFDLLVERHAIIINPAASVRGQRYQAVEGKTPEITVEQVRALVAAIRIERPSSEGRFVPLIVGLRDRAILAVLFYTAARAGAVAKLDFQHLRSAGSQCSLRFSEKGGKSREIPVRADLRDILVSYIEAAGINTAGADLPLFRTASQRTGTLTSNRMTNVDICRMVKRRLADADLPGDISPHSFRVAVITDLLKHGEALEDVQNLAGHADPRTTRLYDRRQRRVTRNLLERISNLNDDENGSAPR